MFFAVGRHDGYRWHSAKVGVAVDRQNAAAGPARMRARDEGHHIGNFFDPGRPASRKMGQYFPLAICVSEVLLRHGPLVALQSLGRGLDRTDPDKTYLVVQAFRAERLRKCDECRIADAATDIVWHRVNFKHKRVYFGGY